MFCVEMSVTPYDWLNTALHIPTLQLFISVCKSWFYMLILCLRYIFMCSFLLLICHVRTRYPGFWYHDTSRLYLCRDTSFEWYPWNIQGYVHDICSWNSRCRCYLHRMDVYIPLSWHVVYASRLLVRMYTHAFFFTC
jgi:hypothetical protein